MQLLSDLLFNRSGRITRSRFFWFSIAASILFLMLYALLNTYVSYEATLIIYPVFFWPIFVQACKRLHDAGLSSLRLLYVLIPIIGPLWVASLLLFRRGTEGHNQFGDDPRQAGVDYLRVDIHQGGPNA